MSFSQVITVNDGCCLITSTPEKGSFETSFYRSPTHIVPQSRPNAREKVSQVSRYMMFCHVLCGGEMTWLARPPQAAFGPFRTGGRRWRPLTIWKKFKFYLVR